MNRRWRPRVASLMAPRSPWYADEGSAARPSASPRKPPSARAITVIPVMILRKNHNKEEDHPLLKPQASCLTARATVARLEGDSRRVASTHVVRNDDKRNVPGWTTLWVSLSRQCEKDLRVQTNSGHKCTRPGDIPNGRWKCEEQEIPIPETADLNGDLETYPGAVELKKFPFIIFSPQPINVAWIAMLATFLTFHQLSLAWRGVMNHRWKNWHSFDFIVWKHFTFNFVSWIFGGFTLSDAGEGQTLPYRSFFAYPQIHSEMI